jgi:hypothetical protein
MLIKVNKAKCLLCNDNVVSKSTQKYDICSCGSLKIRGASFFLERVCDKDKFKELSIMGDLSDFNPNENIIPAPPKQ